MNKFFLLSIILISFYSCSSVPITGRQQLSLVSDNEVMSLSLQEYNKFIKTAKRSNDRNATALVERVGRNIAGAVETYFRANNMESMLSEYKWEFNLIEDPQVNAFCMPGGKIVVYTGILPYTRDETGLAVVLGHEVGHAVAKHANERMSNQLALNYGGVALGALLNGSSEAAQSIGGALWGIGSQVGIMLPFNRKQELEADELGLILMAMAGYNPNEAIPFWERMSQQNKGGMELLSTHPSDGNRIKAIEKELPEAMKYYNTYNNKVSPVNTPKGKTSTSSEWHF